MHPYEVSACRSDSLSSAGSMAEEGAHLIEMFHLELQEHSTGVIPEPGTSPPRGLPPQRTAASPPHPWGHRRRPSQDEREGRRQRQRLLKWQHFQASLQPEHGGEPQGWAHAAVTLALPGKRQLGEGGVLRPLQAGECSCAIKRSRSGALA